MPWTYVSSDDIVRRFRPLTDAEKEIIDTLIADAADILETAAMNLGIPAVSSAQDNTASRSYVRIVASMVIRVLRNPDGYLTETIDDYTYRRDTAVSAGALYVSEDEVLQLRPALAPRQKGAFSITQSNEGGSRYYGGYDHRGWYS